MGILTALRRVAESFTGPKPIEFYCVTDANSAAVYQGFSNGLRLTILQDYDFSPWSWMVEDARDGKIIAFRGSCPSYGDAERGIIEWLSTRGQGSVDPLPPAA